MAKAISCWDTGDESSSSCPIYAFGFGDSHDSHMLSTLAQRAEGLYCHIESAENIGACFAECIGGLSTTVAQNARLTIECAAGSAAVETLLCTYTHEGSEVKFGDIHAEETKDIVVELSLPAVAEPAEAAAVLTLTLDYWDVRRREAVTVSESVCCARVDQAAALPPARPEVEEQRQRIAVTQAMSRAQAAAAAGRIDAGRTELAAARSALQDSAPMRDGSELLRQLSRDVDECLEGLVDW